MKMYELLITCPKGLEEVLKQEVLALAIEENVIRLTVGGLSLQASLEQVYQCLMHLRCANRVLVKLYQHKVDEAESIKQQAEQFDWRELMLVTHRLMIHFKGQDHHIRNTMFGAQCIKDGINDFFRHQQGQRPVVSKDGADIILQATLAKGSLTVYLDVAGCSLHQRGYRSRQGIAPLKENLASGLLYLAKWPQISEKNGALIDPFCGSGTFLIEAWQMATKAAPGLSDNQPLNFAWLEHDQSLWQKVYNEAKAQHQKLAMQYTAPIIGYDNDPRMIKIANENIKAAGLEKRIQISPRDVSQFNKPKHLTAGLLMTNPPYGERLSEVSQLLPVYQSLGKLTKLHCQGWQMAVLTAHQRLSKSIGLKSHRQYKVKNGALDCVLSLFEISESNRFNPSAASQITAEGQALLNRLKKNQAKLANWLKQQKVSSYRLYDADLVEFNAAIDIYQAVDGKQYVHVQEYQAPKTIAESKTQQRLQILLDVLQFGLGFDAEQIFLKQRFRQKGKQQYQRVAEEKQQVIVADGQVQCFVNLADYLDTGLFLDHRRLRAMFDSVKAKRFLNLFCYTGVASLHAAKAGAHTTNVDLSKTYLNWAKDNYRLNHLTIKNHQFINEDVLQWLSSCKESYDVIFCDPPSFSNSKKMAEILDIQRDHVAIINNCMARLVDGGTLYFSCNLKNFKLDESLKADFIIEALSAKTRSRDFETSKVQHHSFKISKK